MSVKKFAKNIFWIVFVIIFIGVTIFVGQMIYSSIYGTQVEKIMGGDSGAGSKVILDVNTTSSVYECDNDDSITSRGYVYLHGLGDHNPGAFDYQKGLIADSLILDFDYDENLLLADISNDFVTQFNKFALENKFEEIVIIGQSAGGIIASYSANKLVSEGVIELHTLASPLNGYHVSAAFLGEQTGFSREIGIGFEAFEFADVKSYHHKTVDDEDLRSYCGENSRFCDPLKIQNNNLPGSKEFFYLEYTHESIMPAVSKLIIDCHE
jgi:hypothetical protein